ncbi:MAG: sulfur oxidation c-type cytochrome SoxX [Burkholderiaceae bacterium]
MRKKFIISALSVAAVGLLAGCAAMAPKTSNHALFQEVMKSSFSDKGIAKVERLEQDASNKACSDAQGQPLPDATAKAIEAANLKTVKMPSDGKFIGDWKAGDKLAQNGRGMTWNEKSTDPSGNGGNCYNCHQVTKEELSYGTIGPSLYNYGKIRGVKDPASPASKVIVEYTWSKLYNAKSYNACSGMPRFGHAGMLAESQLKDLMALLLDPKSPVNQ